MSKFYYDSWDLIEERAANDIQIAKYVHGAHVDEMITRTTSGGTFYHLLIEIQGKTLGYLNGIKRIVDKKGF